MAAWVIAADRAPPIDLVIANAGISGGTHGGPESAEQTRAVFAVNLDGVLNTVLPTGSAHDRCAARDRSPSSPPSRAIAAFRARPHIAAARQLSRPGAKSLRGELAAQGVKVNVVMPGFVKTHMTDVNGFPMPFLMSAEQAAGIIRRGLAKDRARIAFPWPMAMLAWFIAAISPAMLDPLLRRLPKKN